MVIHAVLVIVNVPFVTAYFTKSVPRQIDVTLLHLPHEYASADLIPVPPPPSHLCTTSAHRCVPVTYTRMYHRA